MIKNYQNTTLINKKIKITKFTQQYNISQNFYNWKDIDILFMFVGKNFEIKDHLIVSDLNSIIKRF